MNFSRKKFDDKELQDVFGIAIQDIYRCALENKLNLNEKFREDRIYDYCPNQLSIPLFFDVKKKLRNIFNGSYYKNLSIEFVKCCYIDQFLEKIAKFDYDEVYKVSCLKFRDKSGFQEKFITYQVNSQQVCIKNNENDQWDSLFTLNEIMCISIKSEFDIEISLLIGAPILIKFSKEFKLKSFVSLLSGYYRLCEKWNFNICEKYYSPYLYRLKKIRCHGPISIELARQKIRKQLENDEKFCPFIFQQSTTSFNSFDVYFENDFKDFHCPVEADIFTENITLYFEGRKFSSHFEFFDYLRTSKALSNIVIPREADYYPNLLLCRNENARKFSVAKNDLPVIQNSSITKTNFLIYKSELFSIKFGMIINEKNDKVMIKEFSDKVSCNLLKEISDWIHLKNSAIINCKGIVLSPMSVLFERCQTSLRDFYVSNNFIISKINMLQTIYSLGNALEYLHSINFTHGYIRFENLYVSQFTRGKLLIKLGDSIGHMYKFETVREKPWLPPEFFDSNSANSNKMTIYSDIWAFGSTVWQICSRGNIEEYDIKTVNNIDESRFPDGIYNLIVQCWKVDYNQRIQSLSIRRILCTILSKYADQYMNGNESESSFSTVLNNSVSNQFYGKKYNKLSIRSRSSTTSLNSAETDTSSLNHLEDVLSICTSEMHNSNSLYEIERIEPERIQKGMMIGSVIIIFLEKIFFIVIY